MADMPDAERRNNKKICGDPEAWQWKYRKKPSAALTIFASAAGFPGAAAAFAAVGWVPFIIAAGGTGKIPTAASEG